VEYYKKNRKLGILLNRVAIMLFLIIGVLSLLTEQYFLALAQFTFVGITYVSYLILKRPYVILNQKELIVYTGFFPLKVKIEEVTLIEEDKKKNEFNFKIKKTGKKFTIFANLLTFEEKDKFVKKIKIIF